MKYADPNDYDAPLCSTLVESIKKSVLTPDSIGIERCIQCGACTTSCPAARFTDYSPRLLVKKVLENDCSVLEDESLWNCFHCYSCHLRCPRNNSPAEIVQVLQQMALNEGIGLENLEHFFELGSFVAANGISRLPDQYIRKMADDFGSRWAEFKQNLEVVREELGLPPLLRIKDERREIQKILEGTGYFEREKTLRAKYKAAKNKKEDVYLEDRRECSGQEALLV